VCVCLFVWWITSATSSLTARQVFDKTVHSRVPPLEKRWKGNGQLFREFLSDTFTQYYEWNFKAK
jgi:hypothetical protein